ncbi:MAG: hypothetical protein GY701_23480 [Sulfitobacter sp.]|nr:hypothetical protein [Sulfitobacter sp.]MCP4103215.1 hypothetical protein [Lentisphaerota bacterium]
MTEDGSARPAERSDQVGAVERAVAPGDVPAAEPAGLPIVCHVFSEWWEMPLIALLVYYSWFLTSLSNSQGLTVMTFWVARVSSAWAVGLFGWALVARAGTELAARHYVLRDTSMLLPWGRSVMAVPYETIVAISEPANPHGLPSLWYRPFTIEWLDSTGANRSYQFKRRPRGVSFLDLHQLVVGRAAPSVSGSTGG